MIITAGDRIAENLLSVILSGDALTDLYAGRPFIRSSTAFADLDKVNVVMTGQRNVSLHAKYVEVGGQRVLRVSYCQGTMISLR